MIISPKKQLEAAMATRQIEIALGIKNPTDYYTGSTATNRDPVKFDAEAIKQAIELLKSSDRIHQEYLVSLLAGMGFTVCTMAGWTNAQVILPDTYADAIQAVKLKHDERKT